MAGNGKQPQQRVHQSDEQRAAISALMEGLWDDSERRAQLSNLLAAMWRDFQSTPEYEELRLRLVDAARHRRWGR